MRFIQCVYARLPSVASIIIIKLYSDLKVEPLSGNQTEALKRNTPLETTGHILSINLSEPTHDRPINISLSIGFKEERRIKTNRTVIYVLIKQRNKWEKTDVMFYDKELGALQIDATCKVEGLVCIPHSSIKLLNLMTLI